MDGTIGEIRLFAGSFAPNSWAYCTGQEVAIRSNTALFSILGINFGGNGTVNFKLPDFAGRVAVGTGQSTVGSWYDLGENGGEENHRLLSTEMPAHIHSVTLSGTASLLVSAADSTLAVATAGAAIAAPGYLVADGLAKTLGFNTATPNTVLHNDSIRINNTPLTLSPNGGSDGAATPHNNMQPFLGLNYIICMYGTFPARN
ncbi:MAG: phage tail protein [Sphingobacteriales bacterium]|nr:MAG: phage tail protein [Sphingobacteriales bacterium]